MKRIVLIAAALICASPAMAQDAPGFPQMPPVPPPILPKIEIPQVPKLGDVPGVPGLPPQARPRETFQDRAIRCQHQAGAAGLNPTDAASYTRACANQ
jgi:hypothetical protein